MDAWLEAAVARLAAKAGSDVADYTLTQAEIDELLELARIAAHESGERTNAPLICYLVGLARGRGGPELDDLVDAVTGKAI